MFREQPDKAISGFIAAVPVNEDTLETHLALGRLMRQRGEIDRAIRLHQNIAVSESLDGQQQRQAQMELAKDCLSAGLLDRAERLFLELIEENDEFRAASVNYLVGIYRDEKEWEKAIHLASQAGVAVTEASAQQEHFHCELAEASIAQGDFDEARRQLQLALQHQDTSARAWLLLASIEESCGNIRGAIDHYRRVGENCPAYISEVVPALLRCWPQGEERRALLVLLAEWQEKYPGTTLLLGLVGLWEALEGEIKALAYLSEQLRRQPSIRGMDALLALHQKTATSMGPQEISALRGLLGSLLRYRPSHRCSACGFNGKQRHWLCPKCKQWGTVLPIKGVEGE